MARRKKSKNKSGPLLTLVVALVAAGVGLSLLMKRSSDPFAATTQLSVPDFLDNANSLRGNTYRLRGIIDERLDGWSAEEGRLFSLVVDRDGIEGGESENLPVHFLSLIHI